MDDHNQATKYRAKIQNFFDAWLIPMTGSVNNKFRLNLLQALPYWIAALLTGLIAVLYTKLFAWSETVSLRLIHSHAWILFVLTPVCFILAWLLVKKIDPKAGGSGIPQVMAALELATPRTNHLVDAFLSVKTIVVKITSSLLMIVGGGVIGREGPTIQIASSVFRKINQLTPESWPKISKKNMIITGAAAGLAAAFNTPLGGIVFAVEELAKTHINFFKTALFTAVIIAGLTAQGLLGPYLYLGYPDITIISGYIFLYVAVVALLSGIMGSIMGVVILKIIKWKKSFKWRYAELLFVISCALIIAFIAYFLGFGVLGSGRTQMARILFTLNKHVVWYLPLVRILGSVVSFTTGASGGIFAPSLGAGATIGALIAQCLHLLPSDTNILILAGMAAFLTGVTRSPFTSAILVLEMTDKHSIIFHLMLAAMLASLIASLIDRHSLYEHLKNDYVAEAIQADPDKNVDAI